MWPKSTVARDAGMDVTRKCISLKNVSYVHDSRLCFPNRICHEFSQAIESSSALHNYSLILKFQLRTVTEAGFVFDQS